MMSNQRLDGSANDVEMEESVLEDPLCSTEITTKTSTQQE